MKWTGESGGEIKGLSGDLAEVTGEGGGGDIDDRQALGWCT